MTRHLHPLDEREVAEVAEAWAEAWPVPDRRGALPRPHAPRVRKRPSGGAGERRLVAAVMLQAVHDARRDEASAREWFASTDTEAWTFEWCCKALGLEAARVRRRLGGVALDLAEALR